MARQATDKTAVEALVSLGCELHGPHWLNPLARDLGIKQQTIANWVSGKTRFTDGPILDALRHLVEAHSAAVIRARAIKAGGA